MKDLLIELFSEEIPSPMQALGSMNFKKLMTEGLVDAGLTYENAAVFFTPTKSLFGSTIFGFVFSNVDDCSFIFLL